MEQIDFKVKALYKNKSELKNINFSWDMLDLLEDDDIKLIEYKNNLCAIYSSKNIYSKLDELVNVDYVFFINLESDKYLHDLTDDNLILIKKASWFSKYQNDLIES